MTSTKASKVTRASRELGTKSTNVSTIAEKMGSYKDDALMPIMMRLSRRYLDNINEDPVDVAFARMIETMDARSRVEESVKYFESRTRYKGDWYRGPIPQKSLEILRLKFPEPIESARKAKMKVQDLEYEVRYDYLKCISQSDKKIFGDDTPRIMFSVMTEKMAHMRDPWEFESSQYKDVSTGDFRPPDKHENLLLYGRVGPDIIDSRLSIHAVCVNKGLENLKDLVDQIKSGLDLADELAKAASKPEKTSKSITVAGVAGAVSVFILASKIVSYILGIFGKSDTIGTADLVIDPRKTYDLTAKGSYQLPPLIFDGGSYHGKYEAYLSLKRGDS